MRREAAAEPTKRLFHKRLHRSWDFPSGLAMIGSTRTQAAAIFGCWIKHAVSDLHSLRKLRELDEGTLQVFGHFNGVRFVCQANTKS